MYSFSLEKMTRDKEQDNLYDIFKQTIVDKKLPKFTTFVQAGEEMRLDKVCNRIYGVTRYTEELMVLNNICNPWSVKEGDPIIYLHPQQIESMRQLEKDTKTSNKLANPKKSTRVDENRSKGVAPTIKPLNLKPITVDTNNKIIKVNTKLQ